MKTLILHIGYPKTGTSSLQWFLHTHREHFRQHGVYYPLTGQVADHAHHALAFALGANAHAPERPQASSLFHQLSAEIDACGANTIVISSEVFLGNLEQLQASREFTGLISACDLRVVCFVRRQSAFLESLYRQFIWDPDIRFAGSPAEFVSAYPVAGDYHAPLSMWKGWMGHRPFTTLVYEQALQRGGCIREFCRALGLDVTGLPAADFDVRRNIAVASAAATEMMRAANGAPGLSADDRLEFARHARTLAEATQHLPLPKALFSPADISHIEARYLESNRRLAGEFVHQPLEGAWFPETAPT